MAVNERDVVRHYARASLERAVLDGLRALGREPQNVTPEDLASVDEFHMGGRAATEELAGGLDLKPGTRLLDLGCGIGGAARFFARRHGCRVTGIDLTPEYVALAETLTKLVGLERDVSYRVGSATDLPFPDASFDVATLLHVGMNIADKGRLCAETTRVLRPGGIFAVYDVMRTGEGAIAFPVPWAGSEAISFLATAPEYRRALVAAGFEVRSERDRRDMALEFFRRMMARVAESGPPPLGLHILMGEDAPAKVRNVVAGLESGVIAPIEMICRRA
jgi:ubiquinone/menaquinone biosynthesis C-methylase UbiE